MALSIRLPRLLSIRPEYLISFTFFWSWSYFFYTIWNCFCEIRIQYSHYILRYFFRYSFFGLISLIIDFVADLILNTSIWDCSSDQFFLMILFFWQPIIPFYACINTYQSSTTSDSQLRSCRFSILLYCTCWTKVVYLQRWSASRHHTIIECNRPCSTRTATWCNDAMMQ